MCPSKTKKKQDETDSEGRLALPVYALKNHPLLLILSTGLLVFAVYHLTRTFGLLFDSVLATAGLISEQGIEIFWKEPVAAGEQLEATVGAERFAQFRKRYAVKEVIGIALLPTLILYVILSQKIAASREPRAKGKKRKG